MSKKNDRPLRVGLAGFGAIGGAVGDHLDAGIAGLELTAVAVRDGDKARRRMAGYARQPRLVRLDALAELADIVVECAPAAVFDIVAESAIRAGRIFVPASVGALLRRPDLIELAKASNARIVVPTGALIGLDAVNAAALGEIHSVTMVTRKPPSGLAGAPYLVEKGIDLEGRTAPLNICAGCARDGARGFPANVNVAAALSLAGIGPDRTRLEIWADPGVERNHHRIEVEADCARFSMSIENVPSRENPRTGKITPLSVVATLRGLVAPLKVGT